MRALSAETLDDCFAHDRDRLSHADAIDLITSNTHAIVGFSALPLDAAAGRYLARTIEAPRSVPGHDNAAVDGYAIRHGDLGRSEATTFKVAHRIAAGDRRSPPLGPGEAARIFTGAPVPDGADTIVMQEDATVLSDDEVALPSRAKHGANLRHAGEDVSQGDTLLHPGDRLRPQDVAQLASLGLAEVPVFEPLRVGILSTGNEIRRPGTRLGKAEVYDANSFLLRALAASLPVEAIDLGIAADDREGVEACLADAAEHANLIITSGGASRGEEDHMVRALAETGSLHAWQIAVKPGRPLGLGTYNDTRVLMLPGNPVAVMVCFLLYAMPLVTLLGGGRHREPRRFPLRADFEMKQRKLDRREFLRGMITDMSGEPRVKKYPRDGSGLISSLRAADGLIEIPESCPAVSPGDTVAFIPFTEFGLHAG